MVFGILTLNTDGTFSYTHDGSENFSDSFSYTVLDSGGLPSNEATVSITIFIDGDSDGIEDSIDTQPSIFSKNQAQPAQVEPIYPL